MEGFWTGGSSQLISSDNAGNVTVDQVPTGAAGAFEERDYAWDDNSRLTSVTAGGSSETYQYSDDGQRQSKVTGAVTTQFLHDGENLLQESVGGTPSAYYTQFPGEWGGLFSRRDLTSGESASYGFDQRGNARILLNSGSSSPEQYLYTAFGTELNTGAGTSNPFRYGGEWGYYRDDPSRLYVRARHLDVSKGRWLSSEPLFAAPAYDYVRGNPPRFADPSGLVAEHHIPTFTPPHVLPTGLWWPQGYRLEHLISDASHCKSYLGSDPLSCFCCAIGCLAGYEQRHPTPLYEDTKWVRDWNLWHASWLCGGGENAATALFKWQHECPRVLSIQAPCPSARTQLPVHGHGSPTTHRTPEPHRTHPQVRKSIQGPGLPGGQNGGWRWWKEVLHGVTTFIVIAGAAVFLLVVVGGTVYVVYLGTRQIVGLAAGEVLRRLARALVEELLRRLSRPRHGPRAPRQPPRMGQTSGPGVVGEFDPASREITISPSELRQVAEMIGRQSGRDLARVLRREL